MPDAPPSPSHLPRIHDAGPSRTYDAGPPCKEVIELAVRVKELEDDNKENQRDIRSLLNFMAGIKMLQALSIGGGFLSIINVIILLITLARSLNLTP